MGKPLQSASAALVGILLLALTACQPAEEQIPTLAPEPSRKAVPISSLAPPVVATNVAEPVAPTAVIVSVEANEPDSTVTSPVPSPTPPLTPTPSPLPPPDPTFYSVEAGDTLTSIAAKFNITLDDLLFANGYASTDQLPLIVGNRLQIPLCEAHEIMAGNTLAGIAMLCGLTLDELVTYNIRSLAAFGSLDAVAVGFVLIIPRDSTGPAGLECTVQPEREQVIEYIPQPGEGIFCLSQKYGVSTTAIIQSNIQRLTGDNIYGQTALLLPPYEGVLYIVNADNIADGLMLADLAQWYDITPENITDWNGNPVFDPLFDGQQLLLRGANLIFGPYRAQRPG